MKRYVPLILYSAVSAALFWPFLVRGETLIAADWLYLQQGLGREPIKKSEIRSASPDPLSQSLPNTRVFNEELKQGRFALWNPRLFAGVPIYSDIMSRVFYPPYILAHALLDPVAAGDVLLLLHLIVCGLGMYALLRHLGLDSIAALAGGLVWMLCGFNAAWTAFSISFTGAWLPLACWLGIRGAERGRVRDLLGSAGCLGMAVLGSMPHFAMMSVVIVVLCMWARSAKWKQMALVVVFGLCVSAPAWVAGGEAVLNSVRAWSFKDAGAPAGVGADDPTVKPAGLAGYLDKLSKFYVGLAGFAFIAVALRTQWRQRVVRVSALGMAAGIALSVAFYVAFFLKIESLIETILTPRWLYLYSFFGTVLLAFGVDARRSAQLPWPWKVGVGLATVVIAVVAFHRTPLVIAGAVALAAAAVLRNPALLIAAAVLDLGAYFMSINVFNARTPMDQPPPVVQWLKDRGAEPFRVSGDLIGGDPLGGSLLAQYGLEHIYGYAAVPPARFFQYAHEAGARVIFPRSVVFYDARLGSPRIDALNVRYVISQDPSKLGPKFRPAALLPPFVVMENSRALPRVWMCSTADSIETAISSRLDAKIAWVQRHADREELRVSSPAPGLLVVSAAQYPGWRAQVDGRDAPIETVGGLLRAVRVPSGDHQVQFVFVPRFLVGAVGIAVLAILAGLGIYLRARTAP